MIGLRFIILLSAVTVQYVSSKQCLPCSSECISVQDPTNLLTGQWQLSPEQEVQGACWDGGCQYSNSEGREKCICFVESGGKISHETCPDTSTTTSPTTSTKTMTTTTTSNATTATTSCEIDCCETYHISTDGHNHKGYLPGIFNAIGCQDGHQLYKIVSGEEVYFYKDMMGYWALGGNSKNDIWMYDWNYSAGCPENVPEAFKAVCQPANDP